MQTRIKAIYARHVSKASQDLYHYTDGNGLLGIFKTKSLWATNYRYLNDSSELIYSHGLLRESISEFLLRPGLDVVAIELFERIRESRDPLLGDDCYVTCFCENGDLLSQWRAYGHGGYSLQFDLSRCTGEDRGFTHSLVKVEYDRTVILASMRTFLDDMVDLIAEFRRTLPRTTDLSIRVDCEQFAAKALSLLIAKAKHPAFTSEHEWRIVQITGGNLYDEASKDLLEFRNGFYGLTPYIPLKLTGRGVFPMKEIKHGPSIYPGNVKHALALAAQKYGLDASIAGSELPVRLGR